MINENVSLQVLQNYNNIIFNLDKSAGFASFWGSNADSNDLALKLNILLLVDKRLGHLEDIARAKQFFFMVM